MPGGCVRLIVTGMNLFTNPLAARKWCHVVCTIYRPQELFNVPATARFCERSIGNACSFAGWTVIAVAVSPTQVRLLVRTPPGLRRQAVIRKIQRAAAGAIRRSGVGPTRLERMWGEQAWCFVMRSAKSITAVRDHILGRDALSVRLVPVVHPKSQL